MHTTQKFSFQSTFHQNRNPIQCRHFIRQNSNKLSYETWCSIRNIIFRWGDERHWSMMKKKKTLKNEWSLANDDSEKKFLWLTLALWAKKPWWTLKKLEKTKIFAKRGKNLIFLLFTLKIYLKTITLSSVISRYYSNFK